MTKAICRYTVFSLGLVWMLFSSTSVLAEEQFYRLELGVQAGAAYYMGDLAPYAFMSLGETYGAQVRCKIDPRWALQFKGQRQRVINYFESENQWDVPEGRYQTPMWHFDITGEFNFFRFGIHQYDVRMHNLTPFISLGLGFTAYNIYAETEKEYPAFEIDNMVRLDYAMYIPVGVGLKWKFAQRWQLQLAWQHQIYVLNGDGLEGVISALRPSLFNDEYQMNGTNILNNDVTSTLTVGLIFEFAHDKKICLHCKENL